MLAGYIRLMEFNFIISTNRHFETPNFSNNSTIIQCMHSFEVNIRIC